MRAHAHARTERAFRTINEFPDVLSKRPTPTSKPHCESCSSTYSLRDVEGVTLCRGCRQVLDYEQPPHGTVGRYADGCHCEPCQAAGDRVWARSVLRNPDRYPPKQVRRALKISAADIRQSVVAP